MVRPFRIALFLLAAALAPCFLLAQQTVVNQPPQYHGVTLHVEGIFINPVAGAPFTATEDIRNEQTLADGTVTARRTLLQVGRDSRGRIHDELRRLTPEDFRGAPKLLDVHIFNPQTGLSTYYSPGSDIVRQHIYIDPPKAPTSDAKLEKVEDLGTATMNNLFVRGKREFYTVPAKLSGTGAAVVVVDEFWYSEDLQMNVMIRRSDPRTGVQTVTLTALIREDPPESYFDIPEDYTVVDFTAPRSHPVAHGPMGIGGGITNQ